MRYKNLMAQSLVWRFSGFITSFVLTLLIARAFGPSLSGALNLFIATSALIILVANLNIDSTITWFAGGNRLPLAQLFNFAIIYCLLAMAAMLILAFTMRWSFLHPFYTGDPAFGVFLYLCGLQLTAFFAAFFYGRQDFTTPGVIVSLFNCLQVIVLLLFYQYDRGGRLSRFLPVFLTAPLLQGLCLAVLFRFKYVSDYTLSFLRMPEVNRILRMALVFFLTNLLLFLMYRVDYWMLEALDPSINKAEMLGNYIQSSRLGQVFLLFSSAIGSAIFAGAAADRGDAPVASLCRANRLLLAGGFASYILLLVAGRPVIDWLYGYTFHHIYACCLLLIPGVVLLMSVSVTANYLSGKGWIKYNLQGVALGLTTIVTGNFFLIPVWGIYGSALVSLVGYTIYAIYMLVKFRNKTGSTWKEMLIVNADDRLFLNRLLKTSRS